ncbi:hypothetical protein DDB_G0269866 [Dictyostelium discoideum AX4]|uniref:Uncharacterized protein n=1 Tax=Dictyostelium discoideum TaxID=44689 RepID=Q55CX0_DICDI|nr:hypothetical protein DDB_G0269866 [Dictyostelium discoideum AX4]EAL72283.1 hypothetical protein DDB_G0269866 [Dictyostelium discoideum AX4]|eukprot:XP_646361.1 hypothetical protein DDB_G0269866 [Dictyostelium discoideum AX4]
MSTNINFKDMSSYKYLSKLKVIDKDFIIKCLNMASKKDELSLILDSTIDLPFKFSDISITGWKYNEKIPFTLDYQKFDEYTIYLRRLAINLHMQPRI